MSAMKADELVLEALEAHAAEHGLDIVDVEVAGPTSHPTLRVRIDLAQGGLIDMDAVCKYTGWVSDVVDELDPFAGAYELEVSSPGVDRPLRKAADFERFAGETVVFDARTPIDGRKSWTGTLKGFAAGNVLVEVDGKECALPFDNMKRCHIKPDFDAIMAAAKKAAKQAKADAAQQADIEIEDAVDEEDDAE